MFTKSEQFITTTKLRELRKQRDQLLSDYGKLDRELALATTDPARLQVLYQGLRRISFGGRALHPEVSNLEPILSSVEKSSPDTVRFWREKLEKELAGGRLRSEIVFIFASLLEEWTQEDNSKPDPESRQVREALLKELTRPAPASLDPAFVDELFASLYFGNESTRELLQRVIRRRLPLPVGPQELEEVLNRVSRDRYHSPAVRQQARSLLLDELMVKEFGDSLTLILKEMDGWDWPVEGVEVKAHLTPSKWRLFLQEDLPTACLLEILGRRWQKIFEEFFNYAHNLKVQELRKTTAARPPTEKVTEALRLYRSSFGAPASVYSEVDIWSEGEEVKESDLWEEPESVEEKTKRKATLEELLVKWATENSILGQRAKLKGEYRDLSLIDSYGSREQKEELVTMEKALLQINAEIRLGQAAYPGKGIYVTKADLKNFYPSLPHPLILEILEQFGLNGGQLAFFRRYLEVEVKEGDGTLTVQKGVPNHRRLGDLLGELVLLLLDYYLRQKARVLIVRLIDDITLVCSSEEEALKAWEALEEFCSATGLELNREKCGAVCVGGNLPPQLPQNPPFWSMISLDGEGKWSVNAARFEEYLEQARRQVEKAGPVISRVEIYNNCLNYLVKALGMRLRLDQSHRRSVGEALARFQNEFNREGQGIVAELRGLLGRRFLGGNTPDIIPDGWLHWPITAGGLSLYHPLALATSYAENYGRGEKPRVPEEKPRNWQRGQNSWWAYYKQLLAQLSPSQPDRNQVMETLVKDFIQRGAEISMGEQNSLSTYWRWILYLYGPQILERFGTFRFLMTELVPAHLITGKYRQGLGDEQGEEQGVELDPGDIPF